MTILSSVKKDLKWRLADPMAILLWIGIPLMIGGLMTLVSGGSDGPAPRAHLLLADEDDTFLTQILAGAGGSGRSPLAIDAVNRSEGQRRIDAGDGSAFLILPKGFTQAILDDEPAALELVTNPSQRILPQILQEGMEMAVEAVFYLQRAAGDLLREMSADPPKGQSFFPDVKIAGMGVKVNQRLRSVEDVLFPLVLSVEDELTEEQKNRAAEKTKDARQTRSFDFGLILFPGILFMSLMFMAQGISYDLWREKDQGTLARLICTPIGPAALVLSRVLSGTIAMLCMASAGLALGHFGFDLPLRTMPVALVWCGISGATILLLFMVIQMLASSSRAANVLTSAVLFPLMMVGGTFFPFEAMPKVLADVGSYTPNGISVLQLKNILSGEIDLPGLCIAAGELSVIGVLLFVIATRLHLRASSTPDLAMLRPILFLARTDLRYMLKQRENLLWTFLMPIAFMWFIGLTTGGSGGGMSSSSDAPVPLALVVEAEDSQPMEGGFLLAELTRRLEEKNFKIARHLDAATLAKYARRLTIPAPQGDYKNFTDAVIAGEETVLRFRREGDGNRRDFDRFRVNTAVYTVLADLCATKLGKTQPTAAEFERLREMPRKLSLTVRPAGRRKEIPSGYEQAIPGTMIMFTLMIILTGGAITLVTEREQGLLRRLASTPITRGQIVAGKWLGKFLLGVIQIAFAVLVSVLIFDMDWGPQKAMLGVVLLSWAAFCTSLGVLLANLARSEGQMSGIGVLASMALAALGGCWWPIEITPDWMQGLASVLPTGWAMESIHRLVSFQLDYSTVVPHVLALLTGTVVLGWLARRAFRYE